jgi:UDP-N-acetylmuramate dehydrogenase
VGGEVEWLLEPANPSELHAAYVASRERGFVPRILGGGANLVLEDGLHPGVVIGTSRLRMLFRTGVQAQLEEAWSASADALRAGERAREPGRDGDFRLVGWCGATLPALVRASAELGWSGLEGIAGIPGNLGGGVAMNAGGRWGELWNVVESVRVIEEGGELRDLARADCAPSYRDGGLGGRVVVGAVLRLAPSEPKLVRERVREFILEKRRVQPVTEWSAGCIFKNPDPELSGGRSAGRLIEECGGKSRARGDAIVSPVHGNFIVNRGSATASDVLGLIEELRELVAQRTGLRLETEVQIWRRPAAG